MKTVIELKHISRNFIIAKRDGNFVQYIFKRQFETKEAVRDVSFTIREGELVGFIGPNGAGKSTTIKMMSGILVPSSGTIQVLDMSPYENRTRIAGQIGIVFGQRSQLWWDLPVIDTFQLLKKIYRIDDDTYQRNLDTYGSLLGLSEFLNQPVRQLSLGQRMRADLCAALLHDPKILFLDEPTIGLDVVVKKEIREMIKQINKTRNVTVILTTHDMKDIEEICDRVILINNGQIMLDGPVDEIRHQFQGISTVSIVTDAAAEGLQLKDVEEIEVDGCEIHIKYDAQKISSADILSAIVKEYKINSIQIKEPEIDDIVRNLYLGK